MGVSLPILFVIGFVFSAFYALITPSPIIDVPIAQGVRGQVSEKIDRFATSYETPEEALSEKTEEVLGETIFTSDVLIELASHDELLRVYFVEELIDNRVYPYLRTVRFFENKDGTYLIEKKAELKIKLNAEDYTRGLYTYNSEAERVAGHVVNSIEHKAFLEIDMPYLFFGVSQNPNIENLLVKQ